MRMYAQLGNLTEHLENYRDQARKANDLSGVSTRLPQGGGPDREPEILCRLKAAGLPA